MEKLSFTLKDRLYEYPCFELYQQFRPEIPVVFNEPLEDRIDVDLGDDSVALTAVEKDKIVLKKEYAFVEKPLDKQSFKGFLYLFLSELLETTLDWGILTGIKPVKMAHHLLKDGFSAEETEKQLEERFMASASKIKLITAIAKQEMPFIYPLNKKKVSVYVGIPLCISKCAYCSFISTIADKKKTVVETYLQKLLIEIKTTGAFLKEQNIVVDTLYIGGGTPSILNEEQLLRLLETLEEAIDLRGLREYTFEAGRPETTTLEKLLILKAHGVDRLCLNPQTMNAETLVAVGRNYPPSDIVKVNTLIRQVGFNSVNMDLILGLNHESSELFMYSLEQVMALDPENITIHSLSVKKGSAIKVATGRKIETLYSKAFCDTIGEKLASVGYHPYYLYRQKYTQGNGENIGYGKPGKEGIY
ncbi:MAG: coproporphyrinogen dehydrogenase HemZ [Eubacterium sp.]